jgi:hypothetical protein
MSATIRVLKGKCRLNHRTGGFPDLEYTEGYQYSSCRDAGLNTHKMGNINVLHGHLACVVGGKDSTRYSIDGGRLKRICRWFSP